MLFSVDGRLGISPNVGLSVVKVRSEPCCSSPGDQPVSSKRIALLDKAQRVILQVLKRLPVEDISSTLKGFRWIPVDSAEEPG
jgi:hypothetical protein